MDEALRFAINSSARSRKDCNKKLSFDPRVPKFYVCYFLVVCRESYIERQSRLRGRRFRIVLFEVRNKLSALVNFGADPCAYHCVANRRAAYHCAANQRRSHCRVPYRSAAFASV
jgi:hypothetical protein